MHYDSIKVALDRVALERNPKIILKIRRSDKSKIQRSQFRYERSSPAERFQFVLSSLAPLKMFSPWVQKNEDTVMDDPDWYHRPLSLEDMLAGGSLIIVATISILIYAVVMKVMRKQDKVLATHFQPWYVTFYYEPSSYGMLAEDFALYLSGGQSTMFLVYHLAAIIPPLIFYTWTIIILVKRRRSAQKATMHMLNSHIESRLLLPCVINMVVFIVGQVVITHGTGEGKWAGFTVMLVFCTNSALNPLLLLICSKSIRRQVLAVIGMRHLSYTSEKFTSLIYK
ncbi:hypothetical protein TELCIR_05046 [Teladorsagia circumcincta]|uniref:G protein-coupled receptor n=1 Tax=Teladorsagia circumcincta TaxID=45464 RepID=A0A2G9URW1_TELCI|nr:hypothetical protein TELCIR_05046 [Teladorsagia circumcincta]